jgi:hypothetical protein
MRIADVTTNISRPVAATSRKKVCTIRNGFEADQSRDGSGEGVDAPLTLAGLMNHPVEQRCRFFVYVAYLVDK